MKYVYGFSPYIGIAFLSDNFDEVEKYALANCEITFEGSDEDDNPTYGSEFCIYRYPLGQCLSNVHDRVSYDVVMSEDNKVLSYKKSEYYDDPETEEDDDEHLEILNDAMSCMAQAPK